MGAEQSQLTQLKLENFKRDYITLFVNGKEHTVRTNSECDPVISPQYLLVDYLRDKLGLTGTKYMCREGGCGACIVTVKSVNAFTGESDIRSANSCLLPLFACDGFEITTVEELGNRQAGYNAIQERLVEHGGTQCGFCSSGFVMNMHSLSQSNPNFTPQDVEYNLDANMCRCTGYRPILDAFKSLSTNPSERINFKCGDIEDIYSCPMRNGTSLHDKMEIIQTPRNLQIHSSRTGQEWFKVTTLSDLYNVLEAFVSSKTRYRLVAGNTGTGIYKDDGPYEGFIYINDIPELQRTSLDQTGIVLGGAVTITVAHRILEKAAKMDGFVYASEFVSHLRRVTGHAVRNQGTLSGNLMLKHLHREFTSDVFILLESIGATLTIGMSMNLTKKCNLMEFLEMDMAGKIILSIHLPSFDNSYIYKCYRIGKRYQNTRVYVNAGFLFRIDPSTLMVLSRPRICYGGINSDFIHANTTEVYLNGKPLNAATLKVAMSLLQSEVVPDLRPTIGSREFRLGLTQSYLYRFFLTVMGSSLNPRFQSGASDISRELNQGTQIFDTDRNLWPLNQPIPKLESFLQVSGGAQYINDIRPEYNELFGVFVRSTVARGRLVSVDASRALTMPGVVAFITAKDVPGANNYAVFNLEREEIFAENEIRYYGQSIGLLLAENKYAAFEAVSSVAVKYGNIQKPILQINTTSAQEVYDVDLDVRARRLAFPCRGILPHISKKILEGISTKNSKLGTDQNLQGYVYTVQGEFRTPSQYHFHMETQICLCVPRENGMDVYSSTQFVDGIQNALATCLNVPHNSIRMQVRRLGGAYGAKVTKAAAIACAAAVAAHTLHRPVRVALSLETNMNMIGKRLPYLVKYDAKVDEKGTILKMDYDVWCDTGYSGNEPSSLFGMVSMQSCYKANDWNGKPRFAVTDTAPNTYTRSPGSSQGMAAIENIMEHIAYVVKQDPLEVRIANFIHKGDPLIGVPGAKLPTDNMLPGILKELKSNGDYESRLKYVDEFNKNNRWRKRGLSIIPQRWLNHYQEFKYPTFISVCAGDGTVNVIHTGIEMGQGINTKVAQVVAYTLQIPIDLVSVEPTNNIISPNSSLTVASTTSELCCSSARGACLQLLERLAPVKRQLGNPTWLQLITTANNQEILLTSQFQNKRGDIISYDIWCAAMSEVEIDVLTGDSKIIRMDIIEDAGRSLSPLVDIGQVEGALVMGLGLWLTEELIFDQDTGQLLTDNTFTYNPMLAADIPEDLRVTLLRNAPNAYGVLSSKATGEPPLNMAFGAVTAIRMAINAARSEVGNYDWYQLDGSVTREKIRRLCLTAPEHFTLEIP